ncbi:MAG: hypothetical protein AAF555_11825 [Verrucomicrobiota bacterium]
MIRRLPRHIAITTAAAIVGFFTLPGMFGTEISGFLQWMSLPGAIVSGCVWLTFSLMLPRPKAQQWMILGFFSPFLGAPLLFILIGALSGNIQSVADLGTAVGMGLSWTALSVFIVVPIGTGMGLIASVIAKALKPIE